MQLFSIGLYKLNMDGTKVLDPTTGTPIPTYDNTNIQTFARAWTGFNRVQQIRGNIEADWVNRMDPMIINGYWRDPFPKLDLHQGYIGDGYPLCADLHSQQFLREGATYRLLGSTAVPDLHSQPNWWDEDSHNFKEFQLLSSSKLYEKLCNANNQGCSFKSVVKLKQNLSCTGDECSLDNLRVVRVRTNPPIYYEYVRPPCVDLSFYNDAKKISKPWPYEAMCANTNLHVAMNACCLIPNDGADNICEFTSERLSYPRSRSRCQNKGITADTCDWTWINTNMCDLSEPEKWHWSNASCKVLAKGKTGIYMLFLY